MSSPTPTRRRGWFADRRLAAKFGIMITVVVLAFGGLVVTTLQSNAAVARAHDEVTQLGIAQALVLQLDTRASELKVDGFKALVRDVPADQLA